MRTDYQAPGDNRFWHKRLLPCVVFTLATSQPPWANSQISEYDDCSDGFELIELDENLTSSERRALVDEQFEIEISDSERCEQGGSGSSSGGSSAGGNSSASNSLENGQSVDGSELKQESNVESSPNALEEGQLSVALSSDLSVDASESESEPGTLLNGHSGGNGKQHEALAEADNRKALADSILEKAEAEEDPVVKAALMKRYEELSK
jgi:hypothetical protein